MTKRRSPLPPLLLALSALAAAPGCSSPGTPAADLTPQGPDLTPPANGVDTSSAYLLFNPTVSKTAYLTDLAGRVVHSWTTLRQPGLGLRLLSGGSLLRAEATASTAFQSGGGAGGQLSIYDWDGKVTWRYSYSSDSYLQHHDVESLPSGNVLLIAWEKKTAAEALAAGRSAATMPAAGEVWSESLIEVNPTTSTIVWEWHLWDHLLASGQTAAEHPELVDPNAAASTSTADWAHINSVRYSSALDQILVSVHNFGEIWIIDHGTTTAQAKAHAGGTQGKGGDLLYRWGNPSAWGASGATQLYKQHDARWIEGGLPGAGDLTVFDNGDAVKRASSRVVELAPPVTAAGAYTRTSGQAFLPTSTAWSYQGSPTSSFFARQVSSAQRVASGDTVISNGPAGTFFEVDSAGSLQWSLQLTASGGASVATFSVERVETSDARLAGRALTAGAVVVVSP